MATKKIMMRAKEKEVVVNLIYKDYCKSSVAARSNSNLTDMKNSMVNSHGGLVDYLDEDLEDDDENKNHTVVSERM